MNQVTRSSLRSWDEPTEDELATALGVNVQKVRMLSKPPMFLIPESHWARR